VVIKETQKYLRGRSREWVVERIRDGIREVSGSADAVPVYPSETAALQAELSPTIGDDGRPDAGRVVALMCHEERDAVYELLASLGARPVDLPADLPELVPRIQDRPRRR
jgi:hypothetical protein